jgi:hypothetical protein
MVNESSAILASILRSAILSPGLIYVDNTIIKKRLTLGAMMLADSPRLLFAEDKG